MNDTQNKNRVAVFGTSRSGKDYSIKGAAKVLGDAGYDYEHISFIGKVHESLNGRKLKSMTDLEKVELVESIRKELDVLAISLNIIVDEHFSFPCTYGGKLLSSGYTDEKLPFTLCHDVELGREYEVVSSKDIVSKYDLIFYLDIDSRVILERFKTSEGCKNNAQITLEDVECWKSFEMKNLKSICSELDIPFVLLRDPLRTSNEISEKILELSTTGQ